MVKTVHELLEKLSKKDLDPRRRAEAAVELGKLGPAAEKAVPELLQAIGDQDYGLRCGAAEALGNIFYVVPSPVPTVVPPAVSSTASSATPKLKKALTDEIAAVRCAAAIALGNIGEAAREAVPDLGKRVSDSDEVMLVKYMAADALCRLGPVAAAAQSELKKALRDEDAGVIAKSFGALALIGAESVPLLLELMKDESEDIRRQTIGALGHIGKPAEAAVEEFREICRAKSNLHIPALHAIGGLGPSAVEVALPELRADLAEDEDPAVRATAAAMLGKIDKDSAEAVVPGLIKGLKDENHDVRIQSANALGELGKAARPAVPALCEALKDVLSPVRGAAAGACGKLGPSVAMAAKPLLTDLLNDPEEWLQGVARGALDPFTGRVWKWYQSAYNTCQVM